MEELIKLFKTTPIRNAIQDFYDTLKEAIRKHESGEAELFQPAYEDYKHDVQVLEKIALLDTEKCIASEVEECPWARDNVEFRQKWLDIHKDYQKKSRQLINHWQTRALTAEGINEKSSLDGLWVEVECPDGYYENGYHFVDALFLTVCPKCKGSGKILIPLIEAIAEKREGQLKFKKEKS